MILDCNIITMMRKDQIVGIKYEENIVILLAPTYYSNIFSNEV